MLSGMATKPIRSLVTVAIDRALYDRIQKLRRDATGYLRTTRQTVHVILRDALDRAEKRAAS
jgi:hypothetical protein